MELFKLDPSKHKPGVVLDYVKNTFYFYGFSLPEDAMDFFLPIINWLYEYSSHCEEFMQSNKTLHITFKLSYYNSASYRAFLEMFQIFRKINDKGMNINIDWYYEKNDSSMFEGGKELAEMIQLPINLIEFN